MYLLEVSVRFITPSKTCGSIARVLITDGEIAISSEKKLISFFEVIRTIGDTGIKNNNKKLMMEVLDISLCEVVMVH